MSPIGNIDLPERIAKSRKFSQEEGSAALDALAQGAVSDGAVYDKEGSARSAGDSLKTAIKGAAQIRGAAPPDTRVVVREQSPGEFVFGLTVKADDDGADADAEGPSERDSREDLNAAARERGVNDPESLPNKGAVVAAIKEADQYNAEDNGDE